MDSRPMEYSVIIPANDEEHFLPNTLKALKHAMDACPMRGEVIVVDNDSKDATAQIAREQGAKVIFEPHRQISKARNTGARAATGSYLVFLDADTQISPKLLQRALDALAGGQFCVGGTTVSFDGDQKARSSRLFSSIWNKISLKLSLAAGCFIFTLAEAHRDINGFDEAYYASEEIWYVRRLKRWGKSHSMGALIFSDEPIITSARKLHMYSSWEVFGQILLCALPFGVRSRRLCSMWYSSRPKS